MANSVMNMNQYLSYYETKKAQVKQSLVMYSLLTSRRKDMQESKQIARRFICDLLKIDTNCTFKELKAKYTEYFENSRLYLVNENI